MSRNARRERGGRRRPHGLDWDDRGGDRWPVRDWQRPPAEELGLAIDGTEIEAAGDGVGVGDRESPPPAVVIAFEDLAWSLRERRITHRPPTADGGPAEPLEGGWRELDESTFHERTGWGSSRARSAGHAGVDPGRFEASDQRLLNWTGGYPEEPWRTIAARLAGDGE